MKKRKLQFLLLLNFIILASSCVSTKKIEYFQELEGTSINKSSIPFEAKIQTGDLLYINITATNAEAAIPFNLYQSPIIGNNVANSTPIPYLVNIDGIINFPVLGKIEVAGLTTKQLTKRLEDLLLNHINNPIINIRFRNFRVSVLGEVNNPGTFQVLNERMSIIEAISLAGDLTVYGKRESVRLIRWEEGNKKKLIELDLTDKNILDSPYFILKQNDVIYVAPNKAKVNASAVGPNTGVIISSVSVLIAMLTFFIK
ncbi:polysaccharide biosynthesis/export family protein [Seonamhaeicola sp. MEBiC1930]|uniref:polysaccharide biosynthesis/export family protein n=1 Tax=Seonamhaeicola sp. MEBiC01930 TaxID=2976768 RepID=UPI00324F2368